MQGGSIQVVSKVYEGSCFSFKIPYEEVKELTELKNMSSDEDHGMIRYYTDKRALVVEDNELNVMLLGLFLKKYLLSYDVAQDGEIAIEKYKSGRYDIILTDINLPIRMEMNWLR